VLVEGTIDYTVNGHSKNWSRNLVIEPLNAVSFTIYDSTSQLGVGFIDCRGCIFKNALVYCNYNQSSPEGEGNGFWNCGDSIFNDCTAAGSGYGSNTWFGLVTGYGYGFRECSSSLFVNCLAYGTGSISGTGYNNGTAGGFGFNNCSHSIFKTCVSRGYARNFNVGSNSATLAVSFYHCLDSAFDGCDGHLITENFGSTGCTQACGFYQNATSSFVNCSTDATVCLNCGTGCDNFICDI
jgi:hypothetical protein